MGTYYGANKVQELGRSTTSTTKELTGIKENERLIAVIGNGLYKIAPDVTEASEYDEFYGQYTHGYWLTFKLFVLTNEQLALCPNEGRVKDDDSFMGLF